MHLLLRPGAALLCAACLVLGPGRPLLAQQPDARAAVQQRINRIGAALFSGTDRLKEAIVELKEILAADPASAQAHMLLGIAYRMQGLPEMIGEAKAELRQALDLDPRLVPARFYLAHVYLDLGRAERAREELEAALAAQPNHPQFLGLLGEAERQLKNPKRSVELNRQALAANPTSAESRYYLGLALFDLGERQAGIAELEQVLKAGVTRIEVLSGLGSAYIDVGRLDDAVAVLSKGTHLDPARPELRILLARAYRSKGLLDQAEAQLKAATPAGIDSIASGYQQQHAEFDLLLEQGLIAWKRGRLPAAIASLQQALAMDPAHGPANRDIAQVYLQQGSLTLAADHAARAEKLGFPLPAAARKQLQQKPPAKGPDRP